MYTLTLTHADRQAIDWIGDRYRHGWELSHLLTDESDCPQVTEEQGPNETWQDYNGEATYRIPEHVAWQIADIIDEGLDCFSDDLVEKLTTFRNSIV